MKFKYFLFLCVGSLLWNTCSKSSSEEVESPAQPSIIIALSIDGRGTIRDTIVGCDLLLNRVISGGGLASFDTFPGYFRNERSHKILGGDSDQRVGLFFYEHEYQFEDLPLSKMVELIDDFPTQKFSDDFVYPFIQLTVEGVNYQGFWYNTPSSRQGLYLHLNQFDPNAQIELDYTDLGEVKYCIESTSGTGRVDVSFQGYLYSEEWQDSIYLSQASYSVIVPGI